MNLTFKVDSRGGFFAKNEDSGHIEYAYPLSDYADRARKNPRRVALEMLEFCLPQSLYLQDQLWYQRRTLHMQREMDAA